jgi:hypothetical protein
MKGDEIDRACSTHVGDYKCIQNFSQKPVGNIPLVDLGVDVKIILKSVIKEESVSVSVRVSVDWMHLAPGSVQWRDLMNAILKSVAQHPGVLY